MGVILVCLIRVDAPSAPAPATEADAKPAYRAEGEDRDEAKHTAKYAADDRAGTVRRARPGSNGYFVDTRSVAV
jgi:hypothetical protein